MNDSASVALIGATGGVGYSVLQYLRVMEIGPIKLGLRDTSKLAKATEQKIKLDCNDEYSIKQFIEGSELVINCAGPFAKLGNKVAEVTIDCGIDLVDVNGTLDNVEKFRNKLLDKSRVILACGMMPGLSGALPVWGAKQVSEPVTAVRILSGGRDHLTYAGAADIIQATRNRASQIERSSNLTNATSTGLTAPNDVMDLFLEDAIAVAYQDDEHLMLKEKMNLSHIEAWAIFPGRATHTLLRSALSQETNLSKLAKQVARVSRADVAGYKRYQQIVVDLFCGNQRQVPDLRIRLRALGASELTGAVVAVVVSGVLQQQIKPGVQLCSEAFTAEWAIDKLRLTSALTYLDCQRQDLKTVELVEEGTL